jgi:hypothetical protein
VWVSRVWLPGMAWGQTGRGFAVLVSRGGVVGWLLVENCTVDASILFSVVYLCG